jgi:AcrR family transcriptional regulator
MGGKGTGQAEADGPRGRIPLSRDRLLRAAVKLADEGGIDALTMRRLADAVGTEAMSLYHHVVNKEGILDGLVEVVAGEINEAAARLDPTPGSTAAPPVNASAGWQPAVRQRILAARQVFLAHPWAPALFESRSSTSLQVMRYVDGLVAMMHDGGFSYDLIHHALHALGSRALGFSQELFEPGDQASPAPAELPEAMAAQLPHLAGMLTEVVHDDPDSTLGWCDDQFEFEFGLDLILDGLERLRRRKSESR